MWEFLRAGGPVMFLLVLISIAGLNFIIERGLALRWKRVIPSEVEDAVENYHKPEQASTVLQACHANPSPISRVLLFANEHLDWPKQEITDSVETRARHEVIKLERGLVVLEIIVGIAPLMGLVGTLHGLIALFATLGGTISNDNAALAKGISIALNTTLMGLIVAIPSLIAWSYYSKKVETIAVEMESMCEQFLRVQYRIKWRIDMRFTTRKRRQTPAVIIISLIDILIVLLIFLMVTTTFKQFPAVKLTLPEARTPKDGASQDKSMMIVTVAKVPPHFYLNISQSTNPVTLVRLQEEFTRRAGSDTNASVAIRSDKDAPFGEVLNVVKAANAAKIKSQISVFVQPTTK